jgi:hypothetical protein
MDSASHRSAAILSFKNLIRKSVRKPVTLLCTFKHLYNNMIYSCNQGHSSKNRNLAFSAFFGEKSAFSRASAKSRERAKAPPPPKAAHT